MDKDWLFERLRRPSMLQKGDEGRLRELIARYPYFAAPYLLLGKSLKDQEHPAFEGLLPLISLQAYDRKLLFRLIHETREEAAPPAFVREREKEESISLASQKESVAETAPTPKGPLFQVNFAEVEKEEMEEEQRPQEELPEIPFGWRPLEDFEKSKVEDKVEDKFDAGAVETEEEIPAEAKNPVEEIAVQAEETSDLTEETLIQAEETSGQAEQSRSLITEESETTNEESISRSDFFHWLDKLNTPETRVEEKGNEEKEPASKEQLAIIDRFIEINPSVSRIKAEFYNPVDKAHESEKLDDELITETLARIFVSQEKYERAIAAYEKLQLKFPQKSDYFAALIQELKEKLN